MRQCAKCKQFKPLLDFSFKSKEKKLYISYCKSCNREYQREHYKRNHDDYRQKRNYWRGFLRKNNRRNLVNYLTSHPCIDCGETDYRVLEFDHIRGKKKAAIGDLLSNDASWHTILEEIQKCDVRCANCHKKRTAEHYGWYKSKAQGAIPFGYGHLARDK